MVFRSTLLLVFRKAASGSQGELERSYTVCNYTAFILSCPRRCSIFEW